MFIQWSDTYAIGIPAIDNDHKNLVARLNHFFSRSQSGASIAELNSILGNIVGQTSEHFSREEWMLERADVPDLAAHIAEHRRLVDQIRHFHENFQTSDKRRDLTVDMAEFLSRWLIDHILQQDMPAKPHLRRLT